MLSSSQLTLLIAAALLGTVQAFKGWPHLIMARIAYNDILSLKNGQEVL
jgi:hypothetical protein